MSASAELQEVQIVPQVKLHEKLSSINVYPPHCLHIQRYNLKTPFFHKILTLRFIGESGSNKSSIER
jgi:hypothetical protein